MAQLGHTDPAFTLRVYAHAMRRGEGDKEALKALVDGRHWAPAARMTRRSRRERSTPRTTKAPQMRGFLTMGAAGFGPACKSTGFRGRGRHGGRHAVARIARFRRRRGRARSCGRPRG